MSTLGEQPTVQKVDLNEYAQNILDEKDYPLFDDAVKAAKVGALRAAYVMIWLACAESLKRRFREAQKRDNTAGKIVGTIEDMESQHKSVDKLLLEKAHEYGFISSSGQTALNQIYEMRCIYGHPYEEAPSREKVIDAAATVVEQVLSKPVKLRHGFGNQLLNRLLEDRNYLDDQESAVAAFARSILPRLDESIYVWLLGEYWKELEKLSDDSSVAVFSQRGVWFCQAMLAEVGVHVLTHDEWHTRVGMFPKTLMDVCSIPAIFKDIGEFAQDSLVGSILDESKTRASVFAYLEVLNNEGALSERQQERFTAHVSEMEISEIRASGLSTKTCYAKLIDAMKSYDWYIQNPAISLLLSNGPVQAAELTEEQQVHLGRNILQAGEGRARSAIGFLYELSQETAYWPFSIVRGIALESFTNENNEIRLKDYQMDLVLSALNHLNSTQRDELIAEIVASIDAGTPKYRGNLDGLTNAISLLNPHAWSEQLVKILETKFPAGDQGED